MTRLSWTVVRAREDSALARGLAPAGWLGPVEQAKLDTLAFPARRRKWLLGRIAAKELVQRVLASQGRARPDRSAIVIVNEPSGAPSVTLDGARLRWPISISHRGNLAVAAVAADPNVRLGIDLEAIEPRSPGLVRDFFTEAEAAWVATAKDRDAAIALIWSAKEAALKALGVGLRIDTREIEVRPDGRSDRGSGWQRLVVRAPRSSGFRLRGYWRRRGDHLLTAATTSAAQLVPASA